MKREPPPSRRRTSRRAAGAPGRDEVPPLIEHAPGQFAACHFAGEPLPKATDPEKLAETQDPRSKI